MSMNKASITMQAVCAAKEKCQDFHDSDPINGLIYRLLPEADLHRETMDGYSNGMFTHTIHFRKKYFADCLEHNANDYAQLVVLCGGLDFSCLTHLAWKGKPKFFIDHPDSLALSESLLNQLSINTSDVNFIAADLAADDSAAQVKDALMQQGLDMTKPTLILWEGASYYLDKSKVIDLFGLFSSLFEKMKIVFDYVLAVPEITSSTQELEGKESTLEYVKKHNEPWKSKFFNSELKAIFNEIGLKRVFFESDKAVIAKYNLDLEGYRKMFGFAVADK